MGTHMNDTYVTLAFKNHIPYLQRWRRTNDGKDILISEERQLRSFEAESDKYFPLACRLCGETWSMPKQYEGQFKGEAVGWECPTCRRQWNMWKGKFE